MCRMIISSLAIVALFCCSACSMSVAPRPRRTPNQSSQQQQQQQQLHQIQFHSETPLTSESLLLHQHTKDQSHHNQKQQQPSPSTSSSKSNKQKSTSSSFYTTESQRESFRQNGFLVLSNLLSPEELLNLQAAGRAVEEDNKRNHKGSLYFQIAERGIMMCGPSSANPDLQQTDRHEITHAFRTVALKSALPHVAAELMGLKKPTKKAEEKEEEWNQETTNGSSTSSSTSRNAETSESSDEDDATTVKVLRDIFLGKHVDETKFCGWHVDDYSFWPASYDSTDGINAWIAMQDYPAQYGGSLALAPGSHLADWRFEAYDALGMVFTDQTKEQVYRQIKEKGILSCVLQETSPELAARVDELGYIPDLKSGDVIFHTRWLFHKTAKLTEEGRTHYVNQGRACLNRYSVRYVPGSTRLPKTFVNELSLLSDPNNAGKALNDVEDSWYPTVWPGLDEDIDDKILRLATGRIPEATQVLKSNLNELLTMLNMPVKHNDENK